MAWYDEQEPFHVPTEAQAWLACDYCGAEPGQRCTTKSGRPARYLHSDRTDLLYEAWRSGYGEGWRDALDAAVNNSEYWQREVAGRKQKEEQPDG